MKKWSKKLAPIQMRRRILASILCLGMVFTLLPLNVLAAETPSASASGLCELPIVQDDYSYTAAEAENACGTICKIDSSRVPEEKPNAAVITVTDFDGLSDALTYQSVPDNPIMPMLLESTDPDDTNNDGYHDGDVAVINAIIDNNGLSVTKDDPAGWVAANLMVWDNSSPKRITALSVTEKNLSGALNVSGLTNLTALHCFSNSLTALNASGLTSLVTLNCYENQLTTLNVSGLTSLTNLSCYENLLTALNVSGLTSLTDLSCGDNQLTALNVSGLSDLDSLCCYENQLTALDGLSGLTNLSYLDCSSNQLTELDVSGLTNLSELDCSSNRLTALDMSGLTSLNTLVCHKNPISHLKLSAMQELTVEDIQGGTVELINFERENSKPVVELEAAADAGYTFKEWTLSGLSVPLTMNPISFFMNDVITITPVYTQSATTVDTTLTGLSVTGAAVSPAFSPAVTNYTAAVGNGVTSVTINATAADSRAAVSGDIGEKSLTVGDNRFIVTVTAEGRSTNYSLLITRAASSGGGSSSDSGTTPTPSDQDSLTNGQTTITAPVDKSGNATITVTDKAVADAIKSAQDTAKKEGLQGKMISVEITAATDKAAAQITATLPKTVQETLISSNVESVRITTDTVSMTFSQAAIQQINELAKADVTISAAKSDTNRLTGDAKALIGSRPMFDFNATYGEGKKITDFGGNTVSIAIPYTLGEGEVPGNLYAIYVDGNGKANKIINSSYNAGQKAVIFTTSHFSQYAVGYQSAVGFADISDHWAETDIEFVVSRDLMSGTGKTTFSPNTGMTRGMFVTTLGRLAGIDSTQYKNTKFTDVATDAYYAPYAAWAAEKGIASGTSDTAFSPDTVISRQEMAVFMSNYAKAMGCKVPETRAAITFVDNASIEGWASAAVQQMQMAGVLNGKDGSRFDPAGKATRAEIAAVLHRYTERIIDPAAVLFAME